MHKNKKSVELYNFEYFYYDAINTEWLTLYLSSPP